MKRRCAVAVRHLAWVALLLLLLLLEIMRIVIVAVLVHDEVASAGRGGFGLLGAAAMSDQEPNAKEQGDA